MKPPGTTKGAHLVLEALHPSEAEGARRLPRWRAWQLACFGVDTTMLIAAVALADLGARAAGFTTYPLFWSVLFPVLVLGLFYVRGMYAPRLRLQLLDDIRRIVSPTAVAAMILITAEVFFTSNEDIVFHALRPWAFATLFLIAGRAGLVWSEAHARRAGEAYQPTLIVGAGRVGRLTARRLLAQPELGLRPIGFLDKDPLEEGDDTGRLPVVGASWDLEDAIERYGVEHVIVTFSTAPSEVLLDITNRCERLGVAVSLVPRLFEKVTDRIAVEHLGGLPLVTIQQRDPRSWQFALKYAVDRVLAGLMILLCAPLLAGAAAAVLVRLGRPALYRQVRVGRDGVEFQMLKFRSMKNETIEEPLDPTELTATDTAPGGIEGHDRRTPLGAFLRRTSIDELPQLLNVLRGEMSLVGPRPERPEFVQCFEKNVYRYEDRHRVKAGITGWAQVNGLRGKTSLADRVEWDNYYIENWSLWLDVKIILMTFLAVLRPGRSVE